MPNPGPRYSRSREHTALAKEHIKHDLQDADRDALIDAGSKFSRYTTVGSILGIGIGAFWAFRLRRARLQMFNDFRARERPTYVVFANGLREPISDVAPLLKSSTVRDVYTYAFFGGGGILVGGMLGHVSGASAAARRINRDQQSRERIETAFLNFTIDALRKRADDLESQAGGLGILETSTNQDA